MSDTNSYKDWMSGIPGILWLISGTVGQMYCDLWGTITDNQADLYRQAIKQRMPLLCADDAVPIIGAERALTTTAFGSLAGAESLDDYRARLVDAWNVWQYAGTPWSLLYNLWYTFPVTEFHSPFVMVQQNGLYASLFIQYVEDSSPNKLDIGAEGNLFTDFIGLDPCVEFDGGGARLNQPTLAPMVSDFFFEITVQRLQDTVNEFVAGNWDIHYGGNFYIYFNAETNNVVATLTDSTNTTFSIHGPQFFSGDIAKIAVGWSSSTKKFYLFTNGTLQSSVSVTNNPGFPYNFPLTVGADANYNYGAAIKVNNIRLSNICRHTSTYTWATPTVDANTVVLYTCVTGKTLPKIPAAGAPPLVNIEYLGQNPTFGTIPIDAYSRNPGFYNGSVTNAFENWWTFDLADDHTSRYALLVPSSRIPLEWTDIVYPPTDSTAPSISDINTIQAICNKWGPANAECVGLFVVTTGNCWGWQIITEPDRPGTWGEVFFGTHLQWGSSNVVFYPFPAGTR